MTESNNTILNRENARNSQSPLADRMRPQNLEEFLGQNRILGPGTLLRSSLEKKQLPSMIFWGPPGCGKTSLAQVIRSTTQASFVALSAITSGVKDIRKVAEEAKKLKQAQIQTLLFVDEIHRFNKSQQDALLPFVEDGTLTLIGATTENPSFEINSALLSRCQLLLFAPLNENDLKSLLFSALHTHPRGLQRNDLKIEDSVIQKLIALSDGDARFLLNQLEWLTDGFQGEVLDENALEKMNFHKPLRYDKGGENHFNFISVLHKSIRGSDPQATIYWLHRMIQGGEDPRYILRRLMRMASEDIGLADPQALILASACRQSFDFLGMPEGILALDELAMYLAYAPKSNRLEVASMEVDKVIRNTGNLPVPGAFRNSINKTTQNLGYGRGYLYDHDQIGAYSGQNHLPNSLANSVFYTPTDRGFEKTMEKLHRDRQ